MASDSVLIALIGAGGVTLSSLAAVYAAIYSKKSSEDVAHVRGQIVELDIKLDGRLTELLAANKKSDIAEGLAEGLAQGRIDERTERRADKE